MIHGPTCYFSPVRPVVLVSIVSPIKPSFPYLHHKLSCPLRDWEPPTPSLLIPRSFLHCKLTGTVLILTDGPLGLSLPQRRSVPEVHLFSRDVTLYYLGLPTYGRFRALGLINLRLLSLRVPYVRGDFTLRDQGRDRRLTRPLSPPSRSLRVSTHFFCVVGRTVTSMCGSHPSLSS